MISNQTLQGTIDGLASITKTNLAVVDPDGVVLANTFKDVKPLADAVIAFAKSDVESQQYSGCQFLKIYDERILEFVVIVEGETEEAFKIGRIAKLHIKELIVAYKERFDKDNFVKNLLLDNMLLVDIYNRAKKLHIETEVRRIVMVVEVEGKKDGTELDRVRAIFGPKSKDFVTVVDERNIIIVKQLEDSEDEDSVEKTAKVIIDAFKDKKARVAYGTIVNEIRDVSRSYKEANLALDVGNIFFDDKDVIAYSTLGIGRLIYQLPIPLCKMFISEIFDDKRPDDFDEETLFTINKFFENSLNVSETSRQLYIHRNTLVYRLDKLEKTTGLDIRVFEDAITFKIALMVVKYMNYIEDKNF